MTTLATLDPQALAAAFNTVYEGYVEPFVMGERAARQHVEVNDIALDRSPLWLDDAGDVIGLGALGVRGQRGWVGGFGVAPAHRERGLSHRLVAVLLEAAAGAGIRRVQLEVFTHNPAAIRTYQRAGFAHRRDVRIFARPEDAPPLASNPGRVQAVEPWRLLDRRTGITGVEPAWQREPASLARLPELEGLALGGPASAAAYLLYQATGPTVRVWDVAAADPAMALTLLEELAARYPRRPMHIINEPEESLACQALEASGWRETKRQHELVYASG